MRALLSRRLTTQSSVGRVGRFAALRREDFQIWRDGFEVLGIQRPHDVLINDGVGDG